MKLNLKVFSLFISLHMRFYPKLIFNDIFRNLISEVFHLDKKEVLRKASSLIMALFDPTKSVTAIAIGNAYSHELENLFPNIIIKRLSDLQL
ncbi:Peptidase_M16_C domain-containing protein [Meloidogyne graminicola]|uniref:Peptidase_M16_C domain-containing protein n=1 Tax=Meloidogyne graminicola TaxID=189291 RepID=A0A8S9ZID5_9BILA|nr:Peptidase_M16_C domain-containing protein [Meloidogyne graminicola]